MRIKVTMESMGPQSIDINYNYSLSSFIYNLIRTYDPDYSSFLHERGYENNNKNYKMFCFSMLKPEKYEIEGSNLNIDGKVIFYITSPMKQFLLGLVSGLMEFQDIKLNMGFFKISSIETVPEPKFSNVMRFRCLSPVTISTAFLTQDRKLKKVDLYMEDERFQKNLRANILSKYEILYGCQPQDTRFDIRFMNVEKYRRGKLINYKNNIKIKGYLVPFEINGNPELIRTAYECGLGDRNSLGMGMIEAY